MAFPPPTAPATNISVLLAMAHARMANDIRSPMWFANCAGEIFATIDGEDLRIGHFGGDEAAALFAITAHNMLACRELPAEAAARVAFPHGDGLYAAGTACTVKRCNGVGADGFRQYEVQITTDREAPLVVVVPEFAIIPMEPTSKDGDAP